MSDALLGVVAAQLGTEGLQRTEVQRQRSYRRHRDKGHSEDTFLLVLGRMFEHLAYSNVSLIFECILKIRLFLTVIICILYTYFYI